MTRIGRRAVFGLIGFAAAPPAFLAAPAAADTATLPSGPTPGSTPAFLSAAADEEGRWRAVAFGLDGSPRFDIPLPARGHGAAVSPDGGIAVLFARRPGSYAQLLHPTQGRVGQMLQRATGRWFCGHGCFSADGGLLYATELDDDGEGVVGVYSVPRGFARIGEFPTGGADPHDIRLTPDGRALWVANGGIRTDPSVPRTRLDLETFESGIALIDAASGRALSKRALDGEEGTLSLRHLALDADGALYVAMQHEGPRFERPPLVAATTADGLAQLEAADDVWRGLDHYTGSAAAGQGGEVIAVTSPRGGRGLLIEARSRRVVSSFAMPDGCGVAAAPGGFVVTSGLGRVALVDAGATPRDLAAAWLGRLRWDNHLVGL
ncbi:DUF1513 domain-containing protein [Roseomonas terrae]|uniref:DUF1513 domain-containing protein n=1 Tax=Neoroseomonas terrae TaxID=424799 RepID=A0ABS5EE26_9PROT|nr:DUF1513 domain-containing protein [Neoroseomonas terrae]MBR0649275.1 DUF1513 domain-containing protein [Neoroseomonas terrae]